MDSDEPDHVDFGGVVSAATPEAAEAGVEILERGGNAMDAAVAVSLSLGVSEPAGSGIGGQSTLLIHPADGGAPRVVNGTSYAPGALPEGIESEDLVGHRASTVPTNLKVLDHAWRTFGSGRIAWSELVAPAIRHAEDGFALGAFRHRALRRHARAVRRNAVVTRLLLAEDGSVPPVGARIRQPLLAGTLRRIAEHGAQDFYEGAIARQIVEDMSDHGGWITAADLAGVQAPPVREPLRGSYRGWDVFTLPPPAAGWVVLLALDVLECAPGGELAAEASPRTIWLVEALRIAHRQRARGAVPALAPGEPAAGRQKDRAKRMARSLTRAATGETTHFSVVDADGTVVAVTQSLNSYFGAKAAHPKLGLLYNDYMREFVLGSGKHPFTLGPGAMPNSFMSACVLARKGRPALALGSPGDDRIISAVVQVISHWVDVARGVAAAVAAPRLHTYRRETVLLERPPADPAALVGLEQRGYTLYQPLNSLFAEDLNPFFGGVHAVALEDGGWVGAADPRRDGAVRAARRPPDGV